MPNPKVGTVTTDVKTAVENAKVVKLDIVQIRRVSFIVQ